MSNSHETNNNEGPVDETETSETERRYEGIIGSYNPLKSKFSLCTKQEWQVVGPIVRSCVGQLCDLQERGLRPYLTAMTRLTVWAHREGLPLEPATLLSGEVLEAHAATLPRSAGTFRSQLRRLAGANGVELQETKAGYQRPGYCEPYTSNDVRALLNFASTLTNRRRRRQLTGFVLLGAGCGFSRGDLRGVCRDDVHEHDGVSHVRTRNRCTPVLEGFAAEFEQYLSWCGDGPFVEAKQGGNITDRMTAWVGDRAGVPKLSTDRLRAFFVVEHLRRSTPLLELMAICGFTRVEALEPYLAFLPTPSTPCGNTKASPA